MSCSEWSERNSKPYWALNQIITKPNIAPPTENIRGSTSTLIIDTTVLLKKCYKETSSID
jgi:hypothetical protein